MRWDWEKRGRCVRAGSTEKRNTPAIRACTVVAVGPVRCVGCVRYGGVLSLGAERRLGELSHGPVRR